MVEVYPKSLRQRIFIKLMREKQLVFQLDQLELVKLFGIAHALGEVLGGKKQKCFN